jgi:hypothetical protein
MFGQEHFVLKFRNGVRAANRDLRSTVQFDKYGPKNHK